MKNAIAKKSTRNLDTNDSQVKEFVWSMNV